MDGVINKVSLLNRSFADLSNAYKFSGGKGNGLKGVLNSLSSVITSKDLDSIKEYNRLVSEEGVSNQTAWNRTMLAASSTAQQLFDNEKNLVASGEGVVLSENTITAATNTMTFSAKAGAIALKALTTVASMAAMAIAGMIVSKVIQSIDNYIHRVERAKEALESSVSAFESVQSEIKSLEDQLADVNEQIETINNLDGAQVAKDGELQKLQDQHDMLESNLILFQEQARVAAEDAAEKATNL